MKTRLSLHILATLCFLLALPGIPQAQITPFASAAPLDPLQINPSVGVLEFTFGSIADSYDRLLPSPLAVTDSSSLFWNTFLGGTGNEQSNAVAVDSKGNIYVVGNSASAWGCEEDCTRRDYTPLSFDAFVAKLDPSGNLLWNTYLGGTQWDEGRAITLDASGNIFVAGLSNSAWTCSEGDCTTRDFIAMSEGFAAKLDSDGNLVWNSFLGGTGTGDESHGIRVDGNGNVIVAGVSNLAWGCAVDCTVRDYTPSGTSNYDGYVAKLDSSGALTWNSFLGGTGEDRTFGLDLDGSGNIFLVGYSNVAWSCLVTECTARDFSPGNYDGWIAMVDPSGALNWNSYAGGVGYDKSYAIALDTVGNIYVSGQSGGPWSCTPIECTARDYTPGPPSTYDGFAAKFSSAGTLIWNSFQGGSDLDEARGIALDGSGDVYVMGTSQDSWGSPERGYTGAKDAFVARLDSSGYLMMHSFLGSSVDDEGIGIESYKYGYVIVSGLSNSTWGNPVRAFNGTSKEAFVASMDLYGNHIYLPLVVRD